MCLPLILAQYYKDKQTKTSANKSTIDTSIDIETITLDISESEKIKIESLYPDMNNNKS